MKDSKDQSTLFQIEKDKIQYKHMNQIAHIPYNLDYRQCGILNIDKQPNIITFPELSRIPFIKHGFSTRLGGVSEEHLSTMNLSFSREENKENVITNFQRICSTIGIQESDLVFSDQVHDTQIHVVTEEDRGKGYKEGYKLIGIDGLITNIPNLPLVTFYADCVPLYFVDKVNKAIGLSHSGWRGTMQKMGLKTVEAMTKNYHTNPKDIIAVIGPSICRDCYEVSKDVAFEFEHIFSKEQIQYILERKRGDKYQLDLWLANKYILMDAGILEENISISGICTCCNSQLLYSHRASKGMRGNLAAFLSIEGNFESHFDF